MTTTTQTSGGSRPTPRRSPTPSDEGFLLTLWTNEPELARRADRAGIDRVGVDLEHLGKAERQSGLGTWLSPHREEDLERVGDALDRSALFARVNPLNLDTPREVEAVIDRGAEVVMLPMVATGNEASEFVRAVGGRATVVLLVERVEALERIDELVAVEGADEIHVGINDLALSLGLPNRWLVLAGDRMLDLGERVRAAGMRFGLAGIGRVGDRGLPVDSDLVYAEYARTGATAALISRSFLRGEGTDLRAEIDRARCELSAWRERSPEELAAAHTELMRQAERAARW